MAEDTIAPEVTPAGNETAPPAPKQPVVTMDDESAPLVDSTPQTISLQPGDAPVDRPESLAAMKNDPSRQDGGVAVRGSVQLEIEAGRARIEEHKARAKFVDQKRASEVPEAEQVAAATEANKDL